MLKGYMAAESLGILLRSEIRAASAQSFALRQQATIEVMLAISLAIACATYIIARYIYNGVGVILHAHPVRGESQYQRNATGEVATTSPPFYNEPHRSHVLFVKAELGTTFTSWSQHPFAAIGNPSGMYANLCTAAASNNRDHACNFSCYCLLFFVRF